MLYLSPGPHPVLHPGLPRPIAPLAQVQSSLAPSPGLLGALLGESPRPIAAPTTSPVFVFSASRTGIPAQELTEQWLPFTMGFLSVPADLTSSSQRLHLVGTVTQGVANQERWKPTRGENTA